MAGGDYDVTVRATSRDEVGELAVAFNQMSADLAASDRQRSSAAIFQACGISVTGFRASF